jgi:hemoglobin-like flavoprotein
MKSNNDYLTREMTRLRSENYKYKDLMFVLTRQVETFTKMKDHNQQQIEVLNNALNTMASETENKESIAKLVNEVSVHKLQSLY